MTILSYLLLFFSVLISGALIFVYKKISPGFLKLLLSFSGAYLFALAVTHLIPEIYCTGDASIGIFIFAGFFLQIILEFFSEGIEHGHIHIHAHQNAAFPYGVMIGLCLHSFLEGMPLVRSFSVQGTQQSLLGGIIIHHIPVALALMTMLINSGLSKKYALFYLILFASMAPLGALAGNYLNGIEIPDITLFYNRVMAVVIGIFLHISTTILFESDEGHRFNLIKILTILAGGGIAMIL
jgi:zinc transporter ZupT